LFINAKKEVVDNKGQAYLTKDHINKIYQDFKEFVDIPHFSKLATIEDIMKFKGSMNVNFYVKQDNSDHRVSFSESFENWEKAGTELKTSMKKLLKELN